jgi:hypothetical protein
MEFKFVGENTRKGLGRDEPGAFLLRNGEFGSQTMEKKSA